MADSDVSVRLRTAKEKKVELILIWLNKKTGRQETIYCRLLNIFLDNGAATRLEIERRVKGGERRHSTILYFSSELGEIRMIREAVSKEVLYPT